MVHQRLNTNIALEGEGWQCKEGPQIFQTFCYKFLFHKKHKQEHNNFFWFEEETNSLINSFSVWLAPPPPAPPYWQIPRFKRAVREVLGRVLYIPLLISTVIKFCKMMIIYWGGGGVLWEFLRNFHFWFMYAPIFYRHIEHVYLSSYCLPILCLFRNMFVYCEVVLINCIQCII